jgi:hypothetical protein
MRKILVSLIAIFLFVGTFGQDLTLKPTRNVGTLSTTNGKLTAADTISSTAANSWVFQVDAAYPFFYELAVDADTVLSTTATFYLQESINNVVYTNVDTVTWAGTVDTTFSFTQKSSAKSTKYVRLYGSDTGKSIVTRLDFGFWMDE